MTARRPRLRLTEAWATGFALTGSLLFKISTLNVSGWAAKYNTKLAFLRLSPTRPAGGDSGKACRGQSEPRAQTA